MAKEMEHIRLNRPTNVTAGPAEEESSVQTIAQRKRQQQLLLNELLGDQISGVNQKFSTLKQKDLE